MIETAIRRAYAVMEERNYDTIYWAVDLHGVCLRSTYVKNTYEWLNPSVKSALRVLSTLPETKIILWSSAYEDEHASIIKFFEDEGITIFAFNENPAEQNTPSGCFDKKFYFSVLLDDKAGFDPDQDWESIEAIAHRRNMQLQGYDILL